MHSVDQAEHPTRLAAAIFDVDGVLVASPHERAWQEAFAELMQGEWRDIAPATSYRRGASTAPFIRLTSPANHDERRPRRADYFGVPDAGTRAVEYAERKQRRIRE